MSCENNAQNRNIIFISHANPEDNVFTQWLSLQLASNGYAVWCDLTKLLGGEDFWKDIEKAIRERTIKFIYVLSKASNQKDGSLRELTVAQNVNKVLNIPNFVIPALVDDLNPTEFNVQLARINAVNFRKWADGLAQLIKRLEEDNAPKTANQFSTSVVREWWKTHFNSLKGVEESTENYSSNLFPIQLPDELYFFKYSADFVDTTEFPYVKFGGYVITFCSVSRKIAPYRGLWQDSESFSMSTTDFLAFKNLPKFMIRSEVYKIMSRLLSLCWNKGCTERGTPIYYMSSKTEAFYMTKSKFEEKKQFTSSRRSLVGYKTVGSKLLGTQRKRYWHFAISAKPMFSPKVLFAIKPHVLFSDDGEVMWADPDRMHRARRSQCRDWWNDDWRDRINCFVSALCNGEESFMIKCGDKSSITLAKQSLTFTSPLKYNEPLTSEKDFLEDEEDGEHDDDQEPVSEDAE